MEVEGLFMELTGDTTGTTPLYKEALVQARGHDFHLFDRMCLEGESEVEIEQWDSYLREQHDAKEAKKKGTGFKWMEDIVYSIKRGLIKKGSVEHVWHEPGPLGLSLKPRGKDATVDKGVYIDSVSQEHEAEYLEGGIKAGMAVEKVLNWPCLYMSEDEIISRIKSAGRPLTITFCDNGTEGE